MSRTSYASRKFWEKQPPCSSLLRGSLPWIVCLVVQSLLEILVLLTKEPRGGIWVHPSDRAQRPLGAIVRVAAAGSGMSPGRGQGGMEGGTGGGEGPRLVLNLGHWAQRLLSPGAAPPGRSFCAMGWILGVFYKKCYVTSRICCILCRAQYKIKIRSPWFRNYQDSDSRTSNSAGAGGGWRGL